MFHSPICQVPEVYLLNSSFRFGLIFRLLWLIVQRRYQPSFSSQTTGKWRRQWKQQPPPPCTASAWISEPPCYLVWYVLVATWTHIIKHWGACVAQMLLPPSSSTKWGSVPVSPGGVRSSRRPSPPSPVPKMVPRSISPPSGCRVVGTSPQASRVETVFWWIRAMKARG